MQGAYLGSCWGPSHTPPVVMALLPFGAIDEVIEDLRNGIVALAYTAHIRLAKQKLGAHYALGKCMCIWKLTVIVGILILCMLVVRRSRTLRGINRLAFAFFLRVVDTLIFSLPSKPNTHTIVRPSPWLSSQPSYSPSLSSLLSA